MNGHRATPDAPAPRPGALVAVLAFAGITVSLMQTLVIPLLPELPRLLGADTSDTSWAVTATLLAGAVVIPVMGRLGDMYGKRRILLAGLVFLVVGSVTAALGDSLPPMLAGRALQGMAMGVIPLGISIMRDELPRERLAGAVAIMSASLGVGGALGLPFAAFLADNADWHALFWVSAALGAVCAGMVWTVVPESGVRSGGRFDLIGALGLSAGLVALLLAVSKGADWGWTEPLTLSLFAAALVIFLCWGRFELRSGEPLVDLRTTARPQVLLTDIASMALGFAMLAMSLVLPQLLQLPERTGYGMGQSMLAVGLVMAPSGLAMVAASPLSARITNTKGPKTALIAGALTVAAAYGIGIVLMDEIWQLVVFSTIMGAGIGIAYGAMPALIIGATPPTETAAANALNTLMRSIGTSVSSAVAGVILAHMTVDFGGTAVPSEASFRLVMGICAAAALASAAVAAFLPNRSREPEPEAPEPVAARS
jgi:MFS family permease